MHIFLNQNRIKSRSLLGISKYRLLTEDGLKMIRLSVMWMILLISTPSDKPSCMKSSENKSNWPGPLIALDILTHKWPSNISWDFKVRVSKELTIDIFFREKIKAY